MNDILVAVVIGGAGLIFSAIYSWRSSKKIAEEVAKEICQETWEEWMKEDSQ